jgi:hypothetical protein
MKNKRNLFKKKRKKWERKWKKRKKDK